MGRLDGKVIVITGALGGMGESHVRMCVEEGAKVVAADVAGDFGAIFSGVSRRNCRFVHFDVTDESQWTEAVEVAIDGFGRVDALVNNAAILTRGTVETMTADEFRRTIDINLTGAFLGMRAVVPAMPAGGGVIVNISSTAGLSGYSKSAAYVASKWGLRGLTKAAALDLGPRGIRVVSIHPGPIRTPMAQISDESLLARPIPRAGRPEEVSRMLVFAIAEASFSTGSEFIIDGGQSASFG